MITNQALHGPIQLGAVFFHDHNGRKGLSPTTQLRLDHVVQLYQSTVIQDILCLGGCEQEALYSGARKMKDYCIQQGIPANRVVTDTCSFDTSRNVKNMIRFMNKHDMKSCILISSPMHLYRIKNLAEKFGGPGMRFRCSSYWELYQRDNSLWTIWKDIQYEFAAWLAMWILPEKLHQHILRMWRVGSYTSWNGVKKLYRLLTYRTFPTSAGSDLHAERPTRRLCNADSHPYTSRQTLFVRRDQPFDHKSDFRFYFEEASNNRSPAPSL